MERPPNINLLPALRTTLNDLEIAGDGLPFLIVHVPGLLVAHPCVGSSSSGVDPHDVLEPKIIPQGDIDNLDRHSHELPALVANIGLVATSSNIVIISQVDIEAQLLGEWLE